MHFAMKVLCSQVSNQQKNERYMDKMLYYKCNSFTKLHQLGFYYERLVHIWLNVLRRSNEGCIYCVRFVFTG